MRALIVDDSAAARAQARVALDEAAAGLGHDFDVDEASGGVEALRVLASAEVDLLLVDLHMPGVHGLEVLSFWARRGGRENRRAVVISTQVSPRDRDKALKHGHVSFIEKPVTIDALSAVVAAVVEGQGGGAP
jgi:CheY-like chemotaxis protein